MSIRAINWAFNWKLGSPVSKLVLIRLADYANEEDICWPSIRTISNDTELGESTVRRHIKKLQDLGCLEIVPRNNEVECLSNKYKLRVHTPSPVTAPPSALNPPTSAAALEPLINHQRTS